ncbi:MAG: 30S ribosomal protein S6e [Candidatus Aenigmarchaeota archaeon]|nr:30S ribosomal protein S6e [Candidatus Aenigmarchaeota archaeon]
MPTVKITVSNPAKKTAVQREFEEPQAIFLGKKLGDKVPADSIGLAGIELEITGGSDKEGFPMRKDIEGQGRKRVVLSGPPGFHPDRAGKRKRKSVRGNTISADIVQINTKIVKQGAKAAEELWGVKPKEKQKEEKAAKTETKPAEEKMAGQKPEAKAEAKPAEHKHEKPKEEGAAEKAEAKMGVKKVE